MRQIFKLIVLLIPTLAGASFLDQLYDFDNARLGVMGLYIAGGLNLNMDDSMFDKEGRKIEKELVYHQDTGTYSEEGFSYKSMEIWVPFKLGYAFNNHYSAGTIVPVAILSHTTTIGGIDYKETNFGFGNPWIWSKAIYMPNNDIMIGPRLGVRIPALAYTLDDYFNDISDNIINPKYDTKAITGDKSLVIDLSAMFAIRPISASFRLDGQVAFRYSFENTLHFNMPFYDQASGTIRIVTVEARGTPGAWLDIRAMPGLTLNDNKNLEAYLWLQYSMMLTEGRSSMTGAEIETVKYTSKGGSMFTAGIKGDYAFDTKNNLEFKILYDLFAHGSETTTTGEQGGGGSKGYLAAGISFGFGYFGYLPI